MSVYRYVKQQVQFVITPTAKKNSGKKFLKSYETIQCYSKDPQNQSSDLMSHSQFVYQKDVTIIEYS